jgi:hypothetical protein
MALSSCSAWRRWRSYGLRANLDGRRAAVGRQKVPQAAVDLRGGLPVGPDAGSCPYNAPVAGYPLTEAGQRNFIGELVN